MRTLKRISSFVLAFVMVLSLCAGFGTTETVKAEESRLIDEVDVEVNPAVVEAYKAKGQLTQEMLDELFIINEENAPYVIDPYSRRVYYMDDPSWEDAYEYKMNVGENFSEGWAYKVQCVLEPKYDSGYGGFSATTTNATEGYVMSPPAASRSTGYYGITVTYYLDEEVSSITMDVDWTKIPELAEGEVPPSGVTDSDAITLSGNGVETNPDLKIVAVAIKAKEEHIDKYITREEYQEAQEYSKGWLQADQYYIQKGYTVNDEDEYAIWTGVTLQYGYRLAVVDGEYAGGFESNVEIVNNFIQDFNGIIVFLRLGTLEEIEFEKDVIAKDPTHTHSFEYIITEAATEDAEGVMIGTCSCGKKDEVVVPVTGTSGDVTVESESTNAYTGKLANQEEIENIVPLTKEEQLSIVNGEDLVISLVVKDIKDTVSAADKTEIEKKLTGKQLGTYLDVKLLKQIGDAAAKEVTNTKGKVKISIVVPEELRAAKRTFTILRLHNGVVDEIKPVFDEATNTLTFETDRFSTYALAYEDAEVATTPDNDGSEDAKKEETVTAPKTGDTTSVMPYIVILGLGCAVVALANKKSEVL